jgi:hypothetical protein
MTWSINWDVYHGSGWSKAQRTFLDNVVASVEEGVDGVVGGKAVLEQNYPNPFNPGTSIRYVVPVGGRVVLRVYDSLGRDVATLVDGVEGPGQYEVRFDGRGYASGAYFYTLKVGDVVETKMFHLMK